MQTETNKLTLKEKLSIISKDFLDRDGESYTSARTEGRLNWEKLIGKGDAYSEYILHPKNNEELISNAYRIASEMITVMDTPFKVKVNITGEKSCTDSKNLFVATRVFDDPDLEVGQKLDTFIGFTVHEGCHLLYTDFKLESRSTLAGTLQNIIEDERIERNCGESKPGLVNFLKAAKYYAFDKYYQGVLAKGGFENLNTFKKLLNAILAYIRYPKTLDPKDAEQFVDVLLKVREILSPYPTSPSDVKQAAEKIEDVIKDFLKEEQNKEPKQKSGDKEEDKSDPDKSSSDQKGDNSSNSEKDEKEESENKDSDKSNDKNSDNNSDKSNSEPESSDSQQCCGGSGNGTSDSDINAMISESLSDMKDALENIVSEPKQDLNDSDKSQTITDDKDKVGRVCSGDLERGKLRGSYIQKGVDNEHVYKDSLDRVKKYIPAISKVLHLSSTEYKLSLKGMRSGVLDTNKLAEAYQGVPTVYTREGDVRTDKVCVCILIDESGSMWGDGEAKARDTAVLLNEALSKLNNVDLYIYGHTASRSTTDLFVYREKGFHSKYALGSTDARAGNHDSIAIREAAARVRKFTKEKCLFFMISDGAPNESTDMVHDAVKEVEKDNFSIVAISIDPFYDPSTMYSKNVTLKDMNTLAFEIGKLVKKAVIDNTKKKINL